MGGKKYHNAISFYMWNGTYSGSQASFNLNKKYDTFDFTFGRIDYSKRAPAELKITLDGETYTIVSAQADDLPKKYSIPVKNVTQMILFVSSPSAANTYDITYGIGEATFYPYEAHVHSYTSKITKEATCKEEGVKTFTCECGDTYTEKIAKTAHTYTTKVVKPTYDAQGYTLYTYYVKVRTYKTVNGTKYYSGYTAVKKIKVK